MKQVQSQRLGGKTVYLLRGPSGTGKSTLAKDLEVKEVFSADDFYMKDGIYNFNPNQIGIAHGICKKKTEQAMKDGIYPIAVDNTFTKSFEIKPYLVLAQQYGYDVEFVEPDWSPELRNEDGTWNADFIEKMQKTPERVKMNKSLPRDIVDKMVNRYQYDLTPEGVLGRE